MRTLLVRAQQDVPEGIASTSQPPSSSSGLANGGAIEVMTETYSRVPAPLSHFVVYTLGGAAARVPPERTAVSYREARHAVLAIGMWEAPEDDEKNVRWVREFVAAMELHASPGFYPDYEVSTAPDRLNAAFGPEKYQRLAMIKNRYDPDNVFRLNQNIQPAAVL